MLTFEEVIWEGKTKRWEVYSGSQRIGRVMWYNWWRKYVFAPCFPIYVDNTCLKEITEFLEEQTNGHLRKNKSSIQDN